MYFLPVSLWFEFQSTGIISNEVVHFPKGALGVDAASLRNCLLSTAVAGEGYPCEPVFPSRRVNDRLAADQHFLLL